MKKRILFRCDGGSIPEIGTGHVVRSLILALHLKKKTPNTQIAFLVSCCEETVAKISKHGLGVFTIKKGEDEAFATVKAIMEFNPDIVVIDRLATDSDYVALIKKMGVIVITLDDLGKGAKYADITINPILSTGRGLYEGFDYMVIPDIGGVRPSCKERCCNVFVSFGGFDYQDITKKTVYNLAKKELPFNLHVVVSKLYKDYNRLKKLSKDNRKIRFYRELSIFNFAELLRRSDIAVVSGGLTMFQAVANGVPAIVISHYKHQLENAKRLSELGAVVNMGLAKTLRQDALIKVLFELADDFSRRKDISTIGKNLIDGLGTERVAELIGIVDRLAWDSKFFGVNIAYLYPKTIRENIARFALQKCKEDNIECLYYLCNCHDPESVRLAERYGFHFVDIRVTFEIGLKGLQDQRHADAYAGDQRLQDFLSSENNLIIRPARKKDDAMLEKIARKSYIDSRYFFDKHFPKDKCKKFYADWIKKSARGKLDDAVLVAQVSGEVAGYVSCKADSPNLGSIGLIGVSERFRDKKIGKVLVKAALKWFSQKAVSKVTVVTQGRNVVAQRFYQSSGFKTALTELWYHKWFKKEYHV